MEISAPRAPRNGAGAQDYFDDDGDDDHKNDYDDEEEEGGGGSAFSSSYAHDLASEERLLLSAWESTLLLKDVTFAVCATDADKLKWLQVQPGCLHLHI